MQVFIIGSPLETAKALDNRRLNKQIIECYQIFGTISGAKAWRNHPVILEYTNYVSWLILYTMILEAYRGKKYSLADKFNEKISDVIKPPFHTEEFYNQMKRRLYTKDSNYYSQWTDLGTSDENWYYVDGVMRKYVNGKRIE